MQCNMELNEDKSQWHVSEWEWEMGNGIGKWGWEWGMGLGNETRRSDRKTGKENLPGILDWEVVLGGLTGKSLSWFPWYPKSSLLSCTMKEFPKRP